MSILGDESRSERYLTVSQTGVWVGAVGARVVVVGTGEVAVVATDVGEFDAPAVVGDIEVQFVQYLPGT